MAYKTETGFDAERLGVLAAKTYRAAGGSVCAPGGEWDKMDDAAQAAWVGVGAKSIPLMETLEGMSFSDLAAKLFRWWAASMNMEPESSWEALNAGEKLAWEAAVRMIAWCHETDSPEEVWDMDGFWADWSSKKKEILNAV